LTCLQTNLPPCRRKNGWLRDKSICPARCGIAGLSRETRESFLRSHRFGAFLRDHQINFGNNQLAITEWRYYTQEKKESQKKVNRIFFLFF
jgi:hypothetical protein